MRYGIGRRGQSCEERGHVGYSPTRSLGRFSVAPLMLSGEYGARASCREGFMTKTAISLFCAASAVAILAWACGDDSPSGGGGGPLPDGTTPSKLPPPPSSTPDAATDNCKNVDASVPTGSYGNPNANAPEDAGGTYTKV